MCNRKISMKANHKELFTEESHRAIPADRLLSDLIRFMANAFKVCVILRSILRARTKRHFRVGAFCKCVPGSNLLVVWRRGTYVYCTFYIDIPWHRVRVDYTAEPWFYALPVFGRISPSFFINDNIIWLILKDTCQLCTVKLNIKY